MFRDQCQRYLALVLLVGFHSPRPAVFEALLGAQEHPSVAKGLDQPTSYALDELDGVNLNSGALQFSIPIGTEYPVSGGLSYRFYLVWQHEPWHHFEGTPANRSDLDPRVNAAFGWRLSLGELLAPGTFGGTAARWSLFEADGTKRVFFDTLWEGNARGAARYTRDGSFLRLVLGQPCPSDPLAGCNLVESPSGQRRFFDERGRLRRIEDRFGGWLDLAFGATGWTTEDSHGRVQVIVTGGHPNQPGYQLVDSVSLTADEGAATYDLVHAEPQCEITKPHNDVQPLVEPYSCLTELVLPDSSAFRFAYNGRGQLVRVELPAGGRFEYSYGQWTLDRDQPPGAEPAWFTRVEAVQSRTVYDWGGTLLGTFTYRNQLGVSGPRSVLATDPRGNETLHYFPRGLESEPGLPISWESSDPDDSLLFLSRREYQGSVASGALVRSHYLAFTAGPGQIEDGRRAQPRLVREKTVFHDDLGADLAPAESTVAAEHSGYDGLGHYRTITTQDDRNTTPVRVHTIDYNRSAALFDCTAFPSALGSPTCPATPPAPPLESDPWVLEVYDTVSTTEGSSRYSSRSCFDQRGFLTRRRVLRDQAAGPTASDLLEVFTDSSGLVASETYYGGDVQANLPLVHSCRGGLPASYDYRLEHTHHFGSLATTENPGAGFLALDRTIEPRTGLAESTRDRAGVQTNYRYDAFGRPIAVEPAAGHGACASYSHAIASDDSRARTIVSRHANAASGCTTNLLERREVLFDVLGRIVVDAADMPNGGRAAQLTV